MVSLYMRPVVAFVASVPPIITTCLVVVRDFRQRKCRLIDGLVQKNALAMESRLSCT